MTLAEILSNEELRQREFPVAKNKIFLAHAALWRQASLPAVEPGF